MSTTQLLDKIDELNDYLIVHSTSGQTIARHLTKIDAERICLEQYGSGWQSNYYVASLSLMRAHAAKMQAAAAAMESEDWYQEAKV